MGEEEVAKVDPNKTELESKMLSVCRSSADMEEVFDEHDAVPYWVGRAERSGFMVSSEGIL